MESFKIKDGILEYEDITHTYLYNGVVIPSITQLLKLKFPDKYKDVPKFVLRKAAEKGTALHKAIEDYENTGIITELKEFGNYIRLKNRYNFTVRENEKPVVLFSGKDAVAAGRFDMLTEENGVIGLEDIKRTAKLDKAAVELQLNLYRIGLRQSYGIEANYLKVIHLREDVAERVELQINELRTKSILKDILKGK